MKVIMFLIALCIGPIGWLLYYMWYKDYKQREEFLNKYNEESE